ncbi:hypothetical protein J6590_009723 [Homalodisca vitripennis]|nr:hypothetical protein J6590_096255 [Homalodisca vitripennis]KAG8316741.1 hypothetical protein J6590_043277 [Homalodisca vitripennis]KAG8327916.1 hypothetical protein J6590_009723 [Homalodisca vitripennis]
MKVQDKSSEATGTETARFNSNYRAGDGEWLKVTSQPFNIFSNHDLKNQEHRDDSYTKGATNFQTAVPSIMNETLDKEIDIGEVREVLRKLKDDKWKSLGSKCGIEINFNFDNGVGLVGQLTSG